MRPADLRPWVLWAFTKFVMLLLLGESVKRDKVSRVRGAAPKTKDQLLAANIRNKPNKQILRLLQKIVIQMEFVSRASIFQDFLVT